MSTFNLRRFANPQILRQIRSDNLIELLAPYTAYLGRRGVRVPASVRLKAVPDDFGEEESAVDYEALANVLLNPDDATPQALFDALFMIDEMSTPQSMEELLRIGKVGGIDNSQQQTPADVATLFYLRARRHLERLHSERHLQSRKSFHYFATREIPSRGFTMPDEDRLSALERDLGYWFAGKKKGVQVRVVVAQKANEVWILLRHGEGFRREAVQKDGQSSSVYFRPEKYDLAVYTPSTGFLRVNGCGKTELEAYRLLLGRRLFGSEDFFPPSGKVYSLDPLHGGKASISCADVDGIESVNLVEIAYYWGGEHQEVEIRKAGDIFSALESRQGSIAQATIIGARFEFVFSDSKTPRIVHLRPPTIASFTRDADGELVARWLALRGFDLSGRLK